jgi:hypothetical protein
MSPARSNAVSAYRRRLKRKGAVRLEVNVRSDDVALIKGVVRALADPAQEAEARALLRERFGGAQARGLKALLAAAPLEGIDLTRDRDFGRHVKL